MTLASKQVRSARERGCERKSKHERVHNADDDEAESEYVPHQQVDSFPIHQPAHNHDSPVFRIQVFQFFIHVKVVDVNCIWDHIHVRWGNAGPQHGILPARMAHAYDSLHVRQRELEGFVHQDGRGISKSKQRVVRKDLTNKRTRVSESASERVRRTGRCSAPFQPNRTQPTAGMPIVLAWTMLSFAMAENA